MDDIRTDYATRTGVRAQASTATLLGQVMFLVAIALGFLVIGSYVGRDLAIGTVWLATGIFVSIINIFLALLNIFSD
jgi:hypothetical protein